MRGNGAQQAAHPLFLQQTSVGALGAKHLLAEAHVVSTINLRPFHCTTLHNTAHPADNTLAVTPG